MLHRFEIPKSTAETNNQYSAFPHDPALDFQNTIDSDEGKRFDYSPSIGDTTQPAFTFTNDIIEENERSNRRQHEKHQQLLRRNDDEKIKQIYRGGTGFSSSLTSFTNHVNPGPAARSPVVHFMRDWWLELIACFFLLAALVAVIITAREYEGHPLPKLPSGISINSILAIFNVILKAAMLLVLAQGLSHLKWTWFGRSRPLNDLAVYDNASRGPLGSIWLICRLRGRDLISTVGALLTIAAVILDPMAQQVIRYYNCPQLETSVNATLPRTNAYMEIGAHAYAGINSVPQALQAAINGGVFVPGAQVGFDCSSGNCTFPELAHTIGMQSVCTDVSDELVFANFTIDTYTTLNATLPSGLYTSYNPYSADVTLMTMAFNSSTSAFEAILGPRVSDTQTTRNLCANSTDPEAPLGLNPAWECRGWGAARCQLSPVVYTISNASIRSGKLNESLTYAVALNSTTAGFSANSWTVADLHCLTASQVASLRTAGYSISDGYQWLPYNVSVDFSGQLTTNNPDISNATRDIVPKECIYQVYSTSFNSLNTFLGDYLAGSIVPYGSRYTGSTVAQQFFNNYGISFESVDSMLNNVTNGMTTYMRQNGMSSNSLPTSGQVWNTDTCIRVRWAYVAFPASLVVLTVMFFVAMILNTSRGQQGVHHDFKSSPLALLFHGLDDEATRKVEATRLGESNEVGELREEAKGMWVQLQPTNRGWRFVADDQKGEAGSTGG